MRWNACTQQIATPLLSGNSALRKDEKNPIVRSISFDVCSWVSWDDRFVFPFHC